MTTQQIIETLGLQPHPEGGCYKEYYRSASATSIYFLLQNEDISHFHKIASDELWLFHQGEAIDIYCIDMEGNMTVERLGSNIENGEMPQVLIKRNRWFAAKMASGQGYALVSCVVSPPFEFSGFVLANRSELSALFPQHSATIEEMTIM